MKLRTILSLTTLTLMIACGKAPNVKPQGGSTFSPYNQPIAVELITQADEQSFSKLPLKGNAHQEKKLWGGDYWAMNKGNINKRWNSSGEGFDTKSPSRDEALTMSLEKMGTLSPSEKFDLYTSRYDYPLKTEVAARASRKAESWEGICNGWAPASVNHNEPTQKIVTNAEGIELHFGSSDIKAILSYYYAFKLNAFTGQLGVRCNSNSRSGGFRFPWERRPDSTDANCTDDLSPAKFHMILANRVGVRKLSFIADYNNGKEVWNHPIGSYESKVINEEGPDRDHPQGTLRVVRVKSQVEFINGAMNSWHPVLGTSLQTSVYKTYEYDLYLGEDDKILEGKWKSKDRPDFLWMLPKVETFEGQFASLKNLLND